jgi:hypothetical protein
MQMYSIRQHPKPAQVLLATAAIVLAACSGETTASGTRTLSLSFTTRSTSSLRTSAGFNGDIVVGPAGELVLKKIQLVVDRVEISPSATTACVDDQEGDDDKTGNDSDCEDVARNPLLVNVPVDDAVHTVISVPVPEGTYTKLEAKLEPPSPATIAALGAPTDMTGNSVRVEGTYKGTPFVFIAPLRADLEFEFNPPLVVDASTKNATVNVDVTRWFIAPNGSVIDPTSANPGGANAQLVANNIRSSFKAFEDDNENGDDDSGEGHSGGDH